MRIDQTTVQETEGRLRGRLAGFRAQAQATRGNPFTTPRRRNLAFAYVAETRSVADVNAWERSIGDLDLVGADYFYRGLEAARSVARIVIPRAEGTRTAYATGFLVTPSLLLTNWHVFPNPDMARKGRAEFGYEAGADGEPRLPSSFTLSPDRYFFADQELDYCLVGIDPAGGRGAALRDFGFLRLNPRLGKTDVGQWASIIEHPGGELKQFAIRENQILPLEEDSPYLWYQSDTLQGSSGAPVFNDFWEVVALHHSGVPDRDEQGNYRDRQGQAILSRTPEDHEIRWLANEGIRVSRIVQHTLDKAPAGEAKDGFAALAREDYQPEKAPNRPAELSTSGPGGGVIATSGDAPAPFQKRVWIPVDISVRVGEGGAAVPAGSGQAPAPALAAELKFDDDYAGRTGYDEAFLGKRRQVPMPTVDASASGQVAPTLDGDGVLHYHHFSLVTHAKRRMPIFTAENVDYSGEARGQRGRKSFGKDEWRLDGRLDETYQIPVAWYRTWKKLDYGHLVRREDNCWGSSDREIEFANADTFHMTNCTPQHEAYNRANLKGLWGKLESLIDREAHDGDRGMSRFCLFAGPIFQPRKDLVCGEVRVPLAFWKVLVIPEPSNRLSVYGFILDQKDVLDDDPPFETFEPGEFSDRMVTLEEIERRTVVRFDPALKEAQASA